MTPEKSNKLQNLFIALAIGLALPPAIGFGLGLWVTKDTAQRMVSEGTVSTQVAICVGQFTAAPNYPERLKELKGLEYQAQSTYLEKGGWAKMPGQDKVNDAVERGCVEKLTPH